MSRWFVRICGFLIAFRAFTNFNKLFQGEDAVLVFFGQILKGSETTILAAVIGLFMLATGVAVNLLAWTITNPGEFERVGRTLSPGSEGAAIVWIGALGFLGYCAIALGTTAGPAWVLYRERR